jgi:colicin import membrane protein
VETLEPGQWLEDPDAEQRRRLRMTVVVSMAAHVFLATGFFLSPPKPDSIRLPPAIMVDLIAALPTPAPEPKAKPAPDPIPKPPPPPPPPPKPKVKILPKQAPSATAKPKVKPTPKPKKREKPKELSHDDALAKLRADLGEAPPAVRPAHVAKARTQPAELPKSGKGVLVAPEVAAWNLATKRHIRASWITPPEFRESGLVAELEVEVALDGRVLGKPRLVRSSGNHYYDDNAIRAVLRSSPLPPPPKAGKRTIIFTPEE